MLIVHSGEGLKKGSIKIPKDKGIVGSCFMSKKKLRIDSKSINGVQGIKLPKE